MFESYRTVHDLPGMVTSAPIPASANDLTAIPPVNGEIRVGDAGIYRATNVTASSVTWVTIPFNAWTLGGGSSDGGSSDGSCPTKKTKTTKKTTTKKTTKKSE
jgi:hypothetical protein